MTPQLLAVLQVESHKSQVEGENQFPPAAAQVSFDAAQNKAFQVTSTPCQLKSSFSFTSTQKFFSAGLLSNQPFLPQAVLILGVTLTQVQDFALGLAEPQELPMGPWACPGLPGWHLIPQTCQLCFMSSANLLRVSLMPLCDWWRSHSSPSTDPWGNSTCHHLSSGYAVIVYHLLCVIIQQIPHPFYSLPIKLISLQFREEDGRPCQRTYRSWDRQHPELFCCPLI